MAGTIRESDALQAAGPDKADGVGVGRKIAGVAIAVVSALFAILTTLSMLFFLPSFWLAALAGLVVVSLITWSPSRSLRTPWIVFVGIGLFLLPILYVVLQPLGNDPIIPKPAPWTGEAWEGSTVEYWDLSTGSRLGYVRFTPENPVDAAPVVYLHGGPGGGIVPTDGTFARELAAEGYEVYLYDQAGVGWSDLLDVDHYTVERMVADLEAIRIELGTERLNLIGHSWGGTLATHYMVEHDEHVERAWLNNPGEFGAEPELGESEEQPDLTAGAEVGIPFKGRPPARLLMANLFGAFGANLTAMQDLTSQEQIIRYTPDYVDIGKTFQSSRCANNPYSDAELEFAPRTNFNLYANIQLNRDVGTYDAVAGLDTIATPVLVARGICDFIPWENQRIYRENIPGAQLIVIPNEGHDMRPTAEIAAFFNDGKHGVELYTSDDLPSPG